MKPENQTILTTWSEKLGVPVPQLEKKIQEVLLEQQKMYPGHPDQWYEDRAMSLTGNAMGPSLRSNAAPMHVVFFAIGDKYDVAGKATSDKKALYKDDREKALVQNEDGVSEVAGPSTVFKGKAIAEGTPLDTRKWFVEPDAEGKNGKKNPNYGGQLMPFYQKTALGWAKRQKDGKAVKTLTIALRGKEVDAEFKTGTPYLVRMNIREESATGFSATSATGMIFVPTPFAELEGKSVVDMLRTAPEEHRSNVLNVKDWHLKNKDNAGRYVIIEGDVTYKRDEEMKNGNYLMKMGDTMTDPMFNGQTVFVPNSLKEEFLNFGRGSRIITVGRTDLGNDFESGEKTQTNLNAMGIYVVERVSPEEAELLFPSTDTSVSEA